jgi:phospholipid/cholesterol/gamma-HCH transport system permease protein
MKIFTAVLEFLGGIVLKIGVEFGKFFVFIVDLVRIIFSSPPRFKLFIRQLEFVGNQSFVVIFVSALVLGAVFGLQLGVIFRLFGAESMVGAATAKSFALELAPLFTGFIVTGRAGSAMAAEIATMRVNEQIDAMEAMGVHPLAYLVSPRVLAGIVIMPLLTGLFLFTSVVGCYVVAIYFYDVSSTAFFEQLEWLVWWGDVVKGLVKAAFFGFLFSAIACYFGFNAWGGARGVGNATTRSVVIGLLGILTGDFLITMIQVNI